MRRFKVLVTRADIRAGQKCSPGGCPVGSLQQLQHDKWADRVDAVAARVQEFEATVSCQCHPWEGIHAADCPHSPKQQLGTITALRDAAEARLIELEREVAELKKKEWTTAEVLLMFKNLGVDTECGACMEGAFTGATTSQHTCPLGCNCDGGEQGDGLSAVPHAATCVRFEKFP